MRNQDVPKKLLPLPDAAAALGVSPRFVRKLASLGQVRVTRLGRRILVPVMEVERLAEEGAASERGAK